MENVLLSWRRSATKDEWIQLAKLSGTTIGYLNLVAYGYRKASPKLAFLIEAASQNFTDKNVISKESLVFASLKTKTEA